MGPLRVRHPPLALRVLTGVPSWRCLARLRGPSRRSCRPGQRDAAQACPERVEGGEGIFCPSGVRPPVQAMTAFIDEHRDVYGVSLFCSSLSATSQPPRSKTYITQYWTTFPWLHNLNQMGSGKPGAVHSLPIAYRFTRIRKQRAISKFAASSIKKSACQF